MLPVQVPWIVSGISLCKALSKLLHGSAEPVATQVAEGFIRKLDVKIKLSFARQFALGLSSRAHACTDLDLDGS